MSTLREALEQALTESPDDVAAHSAYADFLQEQADPLDVARGELIQVQLALENQGLAPERQRLEGRERELLHAHGRSWLGELAPYLLDQRGVFRAEERWVYRFAFRRGWLDTLRAGHLSRDCAEALARAPQARLLRKLLIEGLDHEPEDLEPLGELPSPGNVRVLQIGRQVDEGDLDTLRCHISGAALPSLVRLMPKLEELHLLAHDVDTPWLFGHQTLTSLRVLRVYHMNHYPLETLAANPALSQLTDLLLFPHCIEDDGDPYLRLPGVSALLRSPYLTGLRRLQLRMSDMGDPGCEEVVASGALRRLEELDLRYGRIGDEGARVLAACPDIRKLKMLDLTGNRLTREGIDALTAAGALVKADEQWESYGDEESDYGQYLLEGDCE